MKARKKHVDPIPEEFASYEEAAEFWDTHDTADYPDNFHTVDVVAEFKGRYCEIEIEDDVAQALQVRAQQKGVSISRIASDMLRRQLAIAGQPQ